jgi:hypothetical protein
LSKNSPLYNSMHGIGIQIVLLLHAIKSAKPILHFPPVR